MENNKAMDEKSKKDKAREEKEAELAIEKNFPSYYDEYQKSIFSGNVIESKEHTLNLEKVDEEISEWEIMKEILNISINSSKDLMKNENLYKRKTFIKQRLMMLKQISKLSSNTQD